MKLKHRNNLFVTITLLTVSSLVYGQVGTDGATNNPNKNYSFKLLSAYIEYATGDITDTSGHIKPRFMENFDTKLTYIQNIPTIPWLAFSFVLQGQFNDTPWSTKGAKNSGLSSLSADAGVSIFNILNIGASSKGTVNIGIFWNKILPKRNAFQSHTLTLILDNTFFARGNQYHKGHTLANTLPATYGDGELAMSWYDQTEIRIAYDMKFNKWLSLRPEIMIALQGLPLARNEAKNAIMLRFNPRLKFYLDEWTFFFEPRIFYANGFKEVPESIGGNAFTKKGGAFEFKIGIDLTKVWFTR